MHKILLRMGIIILVAAAHPCFAEEPQQICPSAEDIIKYGTQTPCNGLSCDIITDARSYKATGKIYFLKKCPDKEELCKTGSYIIKGDYFVAIPKVNNYYCAAYIPNGYQHPKAVGLIKGENFTETKPEEYNDLHYETADNGRWKEVHSKDYPANYNCLIGISFALQTAPDKSPSITINGESDYSSSEENYEREGASYMDFLIGNVMKVGIHSYIASASKMKGEDNIIYSIKLAKKSIILKSLDEPVSGFRHCLVGGSIDKYTPEGGKYTDTE